MGTSVENRIQAAPGSFAGHQDEPRDSSRDARSESFTLVSAKIELGKDNALYIRGHGEGLRWDRGQPLASIGGAIWLWAASRARQPIEFHPLLHDPICAQT